MKIRRYQFGEDGFMRLQKDIDALINNRNLDHQHIGRLYTEYCDIRSENGETIIEGPTLKMYDRQAVPVKRLQMGYNSADADFNLTIYDATGNPTLYLNSTGEAVFSGNIITKKSATIGEVLKLISPTATFNSGIQIISNDGVTILSRMLRVNDDLLITNYSTAGDIDILSYKDINIDTVGAGSVVLSTASYIESKATTNLIATRGWVEGKGYAVESDATFAFETVEGYTVLVNNGVITDVIIP